MPRILIFGNSGSGKSTMAAALAAEGLAHLDLDVLAWSEPGVRRPIEESRAAIRAFADAHGSWVIEGCYGDLIEEVVAFADEVRFLNPGPEACVENCRRRPWEPHKYATPEEQDARLEFLLAWVRQYETRDDEYSLARHRRIFEAFPGRKSELR